MGVDCDSLWIDSRDSQFQIQGLHATQEAIHSQSLTHRCSARLLFSPFDFRGEDRFSFPCPDTLFPGEDAVGTSRSGGYIHLRKPAGVFTDYAIEFSFPRQVGPFVRIGRMIIEFFRAVRVADVSPAFGTHRVIPRVVCRDRRPGPGRGGVLQLWNQAVPFEAIPRGQRA